MSDKYGLMYIREEDMEMEENKTHLTFQKNADKARNRIIIPQFFIDKHGNQFYMEVYDNFIKLIPIKENK